MTLPSHDDANYRCLFDHSDNALCGLNEFEIPRRESSASPPVSYVSPFWLSFASTTIVSSQESTKKELVFGAPAGIWTRVSDSKGRNTWPGYTTGAPCCPGSIHAECLFVRIKLILWLHRLRILLVVQVWSRLCSVLARNKPSLPSLS